MAIAMMSGLLASPAGIALESGVYQTLAGSTVVETGDRVTNHFRVVPVYAIFKLDFSAAQPSLTALTTNAVLEGGEPFPLTVRSSSGTQLMDGSYRFTGDYLQDLNLSGTQYLFDWRFSASTNGTVLWNGTTGWAGGHLWYVTITNVTLVPAPWLDISRLGNEVQIAWATNFADHALEYASRLPANRWRTVTNTAAIIGNRVVVTVEAVDSSRFFRLRRP